MAAQHPVHHADLGPDEPVGDDIALLRFFLHPSVGRYAEHKVGVAEPVVVCAFQLAQAVGGVLFQIGQNQLAVFVGGNHGGAHAALGQAEGDVAQPFAGIQFIRHLDGDGGLFAGDLVDGGQKAVLLFLHREIPLFQVGGVVPGRAGLDQGVFAQIQLDALAVAVFVALNPVHRLAGAVAQGAVLGDDVLGGDDVIDAAVHRLVGVGVGHLDADNVFGGHQGDHHHQGFIPVPVLVGPELNIAGRIIALRLGQLVEIIVALQDFFGQVEHTLGGGLVLAVLDPAGVIGIEELHGAVGGVQLELDAGLLDGGIGLSVGDHDVDGGLAVSAGQACAAAGHRELIVVLAVSLVAAATAAPAAAVIVVRLLVAALFVIAPAAVFVAGGLAGGRTGVQVDVVLLGNLDDVQQQQHNHQQKDEQQRRHHICGGLPVIERLAAVF